MAFMNIFLQSSHLSHTQSDFPTNAMLDAEADEMHPANNASARQPAPGVWPPPWIEGGEGTPPPSGVVGGEGGTE